MLAFYIEEQIRDDVAAPGHTGLRGREGGGLGARTPFLSSLQFPVTFPSVVTAGSHLPGTAFNWEEMPMRFTHAFHLFRTEKHPI